MIGLTWRTLLTGGIRSAVTMLVLAIGSFLLAFAIIASATTTAALDSGIGVPYTRSDIVVTTTEADDSASSTTKAGGGSHEITAEDAQAISELEGVQRASGFVSTTAIVRAGEEIRGITIESLPADASFVWQELKTGSWPITTSEIALSTQTLDDLGLTVGDRVVFGKKDIGPGTFTITGAIDTRGALDYESSSYGIVTSEIAQVLAGVTAYTDMRLGLTPQVTDDEIIGEINQLVPEVWPITTDELISGNEGVFGMGVSLLRNVAIGLIAVSLIVTAMVLATVYSASLMARSRLVALQRCVGATRGQITLSVITEAVILAVAGGLIGVAVAVITAWALLPVLAKVVSTAATESFTVPWQGLVLPILAVMVLAIMASVVPAIRASRVPPSRALVTATETPPEAGRTALRVALGLALLVLGVAALAYGSAQVRALLVGVGVAATGIGLYLLSRPVYTSIAAVISAVARRFGSVPADLVGANIRRNPRRSAAIGISVTVAAVVTMTAWTALDSARETLLERVSEKPSVDLTVGDTYSITEIDRESIEAMAAIDGVDGVYSLVAADDITMTGTPAPASGDTGEIVADDASAQAESTAEMTWNVAVARLDTSVFAAIMRVPYDLDEVRSDTVYLQSSSYVPFDDSDPVTLTGPLGTQDVKVEYVDDLDVPAMLSPALYDQLTEQDQVRSAWIAIDRATDQPILLDRVRAEAVLAGDQSVGGALPTTLRLDAALSIVRVAAISLLSAAMLVALIGLAATTALAISERRHENAVLRALGLERDQLRRTMLGESIVLGLTGTVLGASLGIAYGLVTAIGIGDALDLKTVTSIPLLALGLIIVIPAIVLWLTTDGVAEKASRVQPAHALAGR